MKNIQINIESPVKHYDIVDQHGEVLATIKFVPTDLDIFDRLDDIIADFEELMMKAEKIDEHDKAAVIELKNEAKKLFADKLDYLFGMDSSAIFAIASPLTLMTNGDVWGRAVMQAIVGVVEEATGQSYEKMKEKEDAAADEYLKKYKPGPGKRPVPAKK